MHLFFDVDTFKGTQQKSKQALFVPKIVLYPPGMISLVKYGLSGVLHTRVAEPEVFAWSWSRIPINTRSRIFLSDSGCPVGSFSTSHF